MSWIELSPGTWIRRLPGGTLLSAYVVVGGGRIEHGRLVGQSRRWHAGVRGPPSASYPEGDRAIVGDYETLDRAKRAAEVYATDTGWGLEIRDTFGPRLAWNLVRRGPGLAWSLFKKVQPFGDAAAETDGTISATPGRGMRLTWSARVNGRVVRIGNANTVDAAIAAIIREGVPRNAIEWADSNNRRRRV